MKLTYVIVLIIILSPICLSQHFEYDRSIGKFKNATSFYINSAGLVYVTDDFEEYATVNEKYGSELNSISLMEAPSSIWYQGLLIMSNTITGLNLR